MTEQKLIFSYFYQAGLVPGLFYEICRILTEKLIRRADRITEQEKAQILNEILEIMINKVSAKRVYEQFE